MIINQKRVELSTYRHIEPHLWNQQGQCVKGSSEDDKAINLQLTVMKADLHRHYSHLLTLCKPITAESIKNAYLGNGERQRTLSETFDLHNRRFEEKVKAGKKSATTLQRFQITQKKASAFLKYHFKVIDLPIDEIKFSFASDFEHYLATMQGIGTNTAMKYVKILKQVLKLAANQGWIAVNPLSDFKCTYTDPQRERLTMNEIMDLYRKDLCIYRLKRVPDFS